MFLNVLEGYYNMEIIQFNYKNVTKCKEDISLCLGYFDGVHVGHQSIIKKALNEGYKVGVLTFDNSPSIVLKKNPNNEALTSVADKAEILNDLGVDYLYIMAFDYESSNLTKKQFVDILKVIGPKQILCGDDFRFGKNGEGDCSFLMDYFKLHVVSLLKIDNEKVSSRRIRELIQEGNVSKVNLWLGRPYRVSGLVVEGKRNGRLISFPTANMELDYFYVYPKVGVYIGYAYPYGEKHRCIINVGTHPSIDPLKEPIIEVHIIDFDGLLYGLNLFVSFIQFVREEEYFKNIEDLKTQLTKDVDFAKKHLPL